MGFDDVLGGRFPGAVSQSVYANTVHGALYQLGFQRSTAIACIAVCRDEICAPFRQDLEQTWGDSFDASALAGVPTLGPRAMATVLSHAPGTDGRRRVVAFGLAHVGIDRDGTVGVVERHGLPSTACGALVALRSAMVSGDFDTAFIEDEPELSVLGARLASRLPDDRVPDLVELTIAAHDEIAARLSGDLAAGVDTARDDCAVATGVLVHGPGGRSYVWPGYLYAVVEGRRHDLAFD
ncbi:MAG: hypothetical protein ACK2T6_07415 [Anaerolineae bacterium]|jgi:hypothetical protein